MTITTATPRLTSQSTSRSATTSSLRRGQQKQATMVKSLATVSKSKGEISPASSTVSSRSVNNKQSRPVASIVKVTSKSKAGNAANQGWNKAFGRIVYSPVLFLNDQKGPQRDVVVSKSNDANIAKEKGWNRPAKPVGAHVASSATAKARPASEQRAKPSESTLYNQTKASAAKVRAKSDAGNAPRDGWIKEFGRIVHAPASFLNEVPAAQHTGAISAKELPLTTEIIAPESASASDLASEMPDEEFELVIETPIEQINAATEAMPVQITPEITALLDLAANVLIPTPTRIYERGLFVGFLDVR
jgi:hypothetical protein